MNGNCNNDFIFDELKVIGKKLILKQGKSILSVDLATFYSALSATGLDIEIMAEDALQRVFEDLTAQINTKLSFDVSLGEKYSYGEDRDNKRGETRQDYNEVLKDDLNIQSLTITIFDEYDRHLCENVELAQSEEIVEFLLDHINNNITNYVN